MEIRKMASQPWLKFYPSDWRADPCLRLCGLGARGLWIEMLAIMHEADPRGQLVIKGNAITSQQLASLVGAPVDQVESALSELENSGVFSRKKNGTIYSRRMEKDENLSRKNRENGKKGGNPTLSKTKRKSKSVKPPDKGGLNAQTPEARNQSPEIETLSQTETPEQDQNQKTTESPSAHESLFDELPIDDGGKMGFCGEVIRLSIQELEDIRRNYHGISDALAFLRSQDAAFASRKKSGKPVDNWNSWLHSNLYAEHDKHLAVPGQIDDAEFEAQVDRVEQKFKDAGLALPRHQVEAKVREQMRKQAG